MIVVVLLASTPAAVARADDSVVVRVEGSRQVAFIGDQSCVARRESHELTLGAVGGVVAAVGLVTMIAGFVSFAGSPRHLVLHASGVGFAF